MSVVLAVTAGALFAAGTYLVMQRLLTRVVIGLGLVGHGANLIVLGSAGEPGAVPIGTGDLSAAADPLPQALVLTAIVITFGVTAFLLALTYRSHLLTRSDAVEDDLEDRRIAELHRGER